MGEGRALPDFFQATAVLNAGCGAKLGTAAFSRVRPETKKGMEARAVGFIGRNRVRNSVAG